MKYHKIFLKVTFYSFFDNSLLTPEITYLLFKGVLNIYIILLCKRFVGCFVLSAIYSMSIGI